MSLGHVTLVMHSPGFSVAQKAVLLNLALNCGMGGECDHPIKKIADETSLTEAEVSDTLHWLVESLLVVRRRSSFQQDRTAWVLHSPNLIQRAAVRSADDPKSAARFLQDFRDLAGDFHG